MMSQESIVDEIRQLEALTGEAKRLAASGDFMRSRWALAEVQLRCQEAREQLEAHAEAKAKYPAQYPEQKPKLCLTP